MTCEAGEILEESIIRPINSHSRFDISDFLDPVSSPRMAGRLAMELAYGAPFLGTQNLL